MIANLDMDVLRTFVLGVELGSFTAAAERVGRSQSAVSTQLRRLEDQIGAPLLRKQGRLLATTEAGEALLGFARRILDLNDEAIETIRGAAAAGTVRLGLAQDFADAWLARTLSRFTAGNPGMQVEARVERTGVLAEAVARGELDFALTWGGSTTASDASAGAELLGTLPMTWIGRPGHAGKPIRQPGEPVPVIAFEQPCVFRSAGLAALDGAGVAWRIAFMSPSLSGLWAAVAAGVGVTPRTLVGLPRTVAPLSRRAGLPSLPRVPLTLHRSATVEGLGAARLAAILHGFARAETDRASRR